MRPTHGRSTSVGLGIILLLVGMLHPTAWYDDVPQPKPKSFQIPIKGHESEPSWRELNNSMGQNDLAADDARKDPSRAGARLVPSHW